MDASLIEQVLRQSLVAAVTNLSLSTTTISDTSGALAKEQSALPEPADELYRRLNTLPAQAVRCHCNAIAASYN